MSERYFFRSTGIQSVQSVHSVQSVQSVESVQSVKVKTVVTVNTIKIFGWEQIKYLVLTVDRHILLQTKQNKHALLRK